MTIDLPRPGLGTSGLEDEECEATVRRALEEGYRHVDTAQMYDNERAVGDAIAASDVPRADVTLATKVHPDNLAYDDVHETVADSLDRLGVDAVDLLYVHWPIGAYDPAETLRAFDELVDEGVTRAVGVSNFTVDLLDEAAELLEAPIAAHQVEMHPYLQQRELVDLAGARDHHLVAYSPLAQGDVVDDDVLAEVGEAHGITAAQASLAWLAGHEHVVPIPKGRGDHLAENLAAFDVELTAEERARIADLDRGERTVDPDAAAWN
jgi:2,5-diketo-D-gluconate reductase B